jgi:hypothetical protein
MAGTSAGMGLGAGFAIAQTTGNRTINGDVTNTGTLVPGTAATAGVLTINGNFLQTASGVLSIRLGSPGSPTDQIYVHGGSATLGGTLSILANRDVETGKSFFLMQTDKGLTGNFTTILFPNLGLFRSFSLLRDNFSAYGVVNRLSFATAGTNANQMAAGSGLDLTVTSTATTAAFATARENIGYQSQSAAAAQLGRISGEGNASVIVGAQVSARAFGEALLRAADDGRGELKKKRKGGFSLWAQALGGSDTLADKASGVADTKASAYGGAAGFDYSFGRVLRLGMGAGYTSGDTKAATQGSKVTTNVTHIGLFAQVDTDFELALALGYGIVDNKIGRITDSGSAASASAKGSTLSGRLQLTVPYRLVSGVRLAPYALFAYDRATRNAFTEVTNDIFGLNVLRRTAGTAEAQLGAKLGATYVNYSSGFLGDEARLVPELRLAFSHLTYAKPLLAQQSFINAPDGLFSVVGPKRDQEAGLAGLSVTLRLTNGFSGYLDYSARVNSQVNSTVLGGVRYVF